MSAFTFRQVSKSEVPTNSRSYLGKYARLFAELMDLRPGLAAEVEVACKKDGYNLTGELRKIAEKEGLILHWSRNKLHTEFYYWLERPKPESVRRTA